MPRRPVLDPYSREGLKAASTQRARTFARFVERCREQAAKGLPRAVDELRIYEAARAEGLSVEDAWKRAERQAVGHYEVPR